MAARKSSAAAARQSVQASLKAQAEEANTRPFPKNAPFQQGEIVYLRSGSFPMTVEFVRETCRPDLFFVEVIFAPDKTWQELKRETLPSPCLSRLPLDLTDDLPF